MNHRLFNVLVFSTLITGSFVLLLIIWGRKPLWKRFETPPLNTPTISSAMSDGKADQIRSYWYGGEYYPGFYTLTTHPTPDEENLNYENAAKRVTALFKANLIESGQREVSSVKIVSFSKRLWLDSELGCALPGQVVIGERVSGWLFALSVGSIPKKIFIYHTNDDGTRARFCRSMDANI